MSRADEVLVIIIILALVLIPFGWVFVLFPGHTYYVKTGEPLQQAAQNAGLTIVNTSPVQWPFPGATGGTRYILEDSAGNTVTVQTQTFESMQSRDAAIQAFSAQTVGKGRPIGTILVHGQELIYIPADQTGILALIASELKAMEKSMPL
ncbi:hypothetical protein J2741_001739 [Methanolinea mesophila]|uniref:hypothetical protein n=1 Tax=Methanolinea mesophila TaxID=547055 RepID=UPI001AEA6064|nr:hypothetical protein [Methanolinea mesophila]MBP1929192.1 hypothetical protein [Methanolinea mesophila]